MSDVSLRQLLQAWLDQEPGRSARAISRRAEEAGHKISHQNLNNIINGKHGGEVGEEMITGIHLGTGLSETRIRRSAGVPDAQPFVLPPHADRLTKRQRDAVRAVIDAMVRPEGRSGRGDGDVTPLPVRPRGQGPEPVPGRAAARRTKN